MAWSGGTFTRANPTWVSDAGNGIGIEAGRHDAQDNDFTTGINQCLNKDGSNSATANLNIGAYRVTNLGTGTARNDAATVAQVQDNTSSYLGTTGGTSTAFTVTATPTITALTTGAQYVFKANAGNGAAATLKIDGTAATTMQRQGTALAGNEFKANDIISVVYDGTNFQITNIAEAPLFVDRTNNRVGVGTTAPISPVDIFIADGTVASIGDSSTNNNASISGPSRKGTTLVSGAYATTLALQSNTNSVAADTGSSIGFLGKWDSASYTSAAQFASIFGGKENSTNANLAGYLSFATRAAGGNPTERMRIDSNGNVGINGSGGSTIKFYVSSAGTGTSNYVTLMRQATSGLNMFWIRDDGYFSTGSCTNSPYNSATGTGANVVVNSDGTLQRSASSLKYKTNIQDAVHGLADVLKLRPVTFKSINNGDTIFGGLIAEEVDAVGLSEFVLYDQEGKPDALHYGNMVSLAFKAIQELNAKVEALEARIAALEA